MISTFSQINKKFFVFIYFRTEDIDIFSGNDILLLQSVSSSVLMKPALHRHTPL